MSRQMYALHLVLALDRENMSWTLYKSRQYGEQYSSYPALVTQDHIIAVKGLFSRTIRNTSLKIYATGRKWNIEPCLIDADYTEEITTYIRLSNFSIEEFLQTRKTKVSFGRAIVHVHYLTPHAVLEAKDLSVGPWFQHSYDILNAVGLCKTTIGAGAYDIEMNDVALEVYPNQSKFLLINNYTFSRDSDTLLRSRFSKLGLIIANCNRIVTGHSLICLQNTSTRTIPIFSDFLQVIIPPLEEQYLALTKPDLLHVMVSNPRTNHHNAMSQTTLTELNGITD